MRVSMGTGTLLSRSCRECGRFADGCQHFFSITRKKVKKFCEMRSRKGKTALNLYVGEGGTSEETVGIALAEHPSPRLQKISRALHQT